MNFLEDIFKMPLNQATTKLLDIGWKQNEIEAMMLGYQAGFRTAGKRWGKIDENGRVISENKGQGGVPTAQPPTASRVGQVDVPRIPEQVPQPKDDDWKYGLRKTQGNYYERGDSNDGDHQESKTKAPGRGKICKPKKKTKTRRSRSGQRVGKRKLKSARSASLRNG